MQFIITIKIVRLPQTDVLKCRDGQTAALRCQLLQIFQTVAINIRTSTVQIITKHIQIIDIQYNQVHTNTTSM